jgi:hypothetical protein
VSIANAHDWFRLARGLCMSLAVIFVVGAAPIVFRDARTVFQNADEVTSQFLDQVAQELTWRLSHGQA